MATNLILVFTLTLCRSAAGTTGAALLFQATAKEMIDAFGQTPRPHGNVIAAEVFQSGLLMSE